jgi:3-hydroxybutyryl-CoA dehydrogenase
MGTGIAIVAARHAGLKVHAFDSFDASIERSKAFVKSWVAKEVKKGRMTEDSGKTLQDNIHYCKLDDSAMTDKVPTLDFVVEAVNEEIGIKHSVYSKLQEAGLRNDCVLGTNTSSISITKLAKVVERPERVIGMHFMNPVPVMPLVEVIRGLRTDDATHAATLELCTRMGKDPATSKDRPGFIANRILMINLNAAILALQDEVASRDDIDKIMKLGTNIPMGPLLLADFIGLDTVLNILRVLHAELGDHYRPAPLLVNYVEAGWLGVKTKRGFYEH